MIEMFLSQTLKQHPGRGAYQPSDCKIFKKALQDKVYRMNDKGRHPLNIITKETL